MLEVAFITCETRPGITADDQILAKALDQYARVIATPWDADDTDWNRFDAVMLRSCWNYHLKIEEFKRWLLHLRGARPVIINPLEAIEWNLHKGYLFDLQKQGIEVPRTLFLRQGTRKDLSSALKEITAEKAVIKPATSASAYNTWVTSFQETEENEEAFQDQLRSGDVIVQHYLDEIVATGEFSLMFFDKQYSHAVLKRPARHDFRVQRDFGGTVEAVHPDKVVIDFAYEVLEAIPFELFFARVDLVMDGRKIWLMEVELIEPVLFFEYMKQSPARAAELMVKYVSKNREQRPSTATDI